MVRFEYEPLRIEQLGAEHGQDKLFKGHAVILKKAAQGKGKGGQDTHPAHLAAQHRAQAEIDAHSHGDGQQGEHKLPQGEAKKQAFLIVPYFLVDAYLQ